MRSLEVTGVEAGSPAINVAGKRPTSPIQGFGRMWQKTYRVLLVGADVDPREVIAVWKDQFGSFWPKGNRFFAPLSGIAPGEVAALDLSMPGRMKLSTGVLVLYADEESFTLMTPQGHMFAGWITFSAFEAGDGVIVRPGAGADARVSDPMYEVGLTMGGHRQEDRFWQHTLRAARRALRRARREVDDRGRCASTSGASGRTWRNVWHNSAHPLAAST